MRRNDISRMPAPRSQSSQAAALANFDNVWNTLVQQCSQASTGAAGLAVEALPFDTKLTTAAVLLLAEEKVAEFVDEQRLLALKGGGTLA